MQDQVLINHCVGLCRFDLLTPISVQVTEEGLHLFDFVVACTYHKCGSLCEAVLEKKGSLSPGGAHFLGCPIARGGKDSLRHNLSGRQEAGSPRTKASLCECLSVPWKAYKSFPPMKTLLSSGEFQFFISHLSIKFTFPLGGV